MECNFKIQFLPFIITHTITPTITTATTPIHILELELDGKDSFTSHIRLLFWHDEHPRPSLIYYLANGNEFGASAHLAHPAHLT